MKNKAFIASLATLVVIPAIVVPFQTEAAIQKPFKDVSKNSPYYDIIHEMRDQGIISGYEDGTFKAGEIISRKHAAALVSRAKGNELPKTMKPVKFKDISVKNPNYADIQKLQQAGIFQPDAKGNFNPNKPVTRAEMAKILTVAFGLETKKTFDFPDVPASHPFNSYVRALYSNGVTTGDNGYFKPNDSLTRAHYAVFMHRAMNLKDDGIVKPIPKPVAPSSSMSLEEFNLSIKKNPLFQSKQKNPIFVQGEVHPNVYKEEPLRRVLTEGQAIIQGTGLKYASIRGQIFLMEDDYVSPLPTNSPQLGFSGRNDGKTAFYIDYTNEKAIDTAIKLFNMLYPDIDVEDEVREKSAEAAEALRTEGHKPVAQREFTGNGQEYHIDGYYLRIGTNGFLNNLWLEIEEEGRR